MRSSTTDTWWKTSSRRARFSSRSSTRCRTASSRSSSRPMACRRRCPQQARLRNLFFLDATCPLVSKVHMEARAPFRGWLRDRPDRPLRPSGGDRHHGAAAGRRDHPDRDRARMPRPSCRATRTSSPISPRPPCRSTTRGTSSPYCERRFPAIHGPHKEDICYATTNRQEVVKTIAPEMRSDPRGRRAQQLQLPAPRRGGRKQGCERSMLVAARRRHRLAGDRRCRTHRHHCRRLGAGSAGQRGDRSLQVALRRDRWRSSRTRDENVSFKLPRELRREEPRASPAQ